MSRRRARGEGTAPYQQPDGRWRAEIVVGWSEAGRPQRKRIYGRTEAECARKLRRALSERDAGVLVAGRSPTLGEWLEYWLDNVAGPNVEPTTLATYRGNVRRYVAGTKAARVRLAALTPEHLEVLYAGMRSRPRPLSDSTVLQLHRLLSSALKAAVQRGRLGVNPADRLPAPRARSYEPEVVLTPADARALISEAGSRPGGVRWMVALALGLRQAEVLGMGWDQVDLEAGTVLVSRGLYRLKWEHGCLPAGSCGRVQWKCPARHGGGLYIKRPKSDAGRRLVGLPAPLLASLRAHREETAGRPAWTSANGVEVELVFSQPTGRPLSASGDWAEWKALLAAAGVPEARLHDARHTAATVLLLMGVDSRVVMDMMGWSTVAMLKRYQHVLDEMKAAAADAMGSALWQAPAPPAAPDPEPAVVSLADFKKRRQA